MNSLIANVVGVFHKTGSRIVLGAALAGAGMSSTAQARHHDDLRIEIRPGWAQLDRRVWVEPVVQDRQTQVWVEAAYGTIPGTRTWVPAEYRTVTDHVWHEAVVRQDQVQVWVPPSRQDRRTNYGGYVRLERIYQPGHYELQTQNTVVSPGHYEDVARQELACDGHWQVTDQQVVTTPGHWETRIDRVVIAPGHWEGRPVIVLH